MITQIKEWVYLLFRPKWERRLYKLLKKASYDKNLRLDTVLYDYCPPEEVKGKIFKAGVDAMFIGWLGLFNTELTASDGINPTLKFYLEQMACYVSSDDVSESDRNYLKDLANREYLGLSQCWQKRQQTACQILGVLMENGIARDDLYIADFVGVGYKTFQRIKTDLRQAIGLKAAQTATKFDLSNWATLTAYFCSLIH